MALTQYYVDPGAGTDHEGSAFVDGSFANATNTLTKIAAFASAVAADKLYLTDNGSAEVTPGMYTISSVTDNDNVVLTADIRSGANDPTDVVCTQGTGAVGAPWATVQHALDNITRDATNGDQINIKAGTSEILAATLSLATYGAPADTAPLVIRGYTSAANDGGQGVIDGDGSYSVYATATNYFHWRDMRCTNVGAASPILYVGSFSSLMNIEADTASGVYGLRAGDYSIICGCYVHSNTCQRGIAADSNCLIVGNFVIHSMNYADSCGIYGFRCAILNNIVKVTVAAGSGIQQWGYYCSIVGNSVSGSSGTGAGIWASSTPAKAIMNNIINGFSGVGGRGIDLNSATVQFYVGNAFYNCTTPEANKGLCIVEYNNDELAALPFVDPSNNDFTIDGTQAGVTEDAWPAAFKGAALSTNLADKGASQAGAGTAGGGMPILLGSVVR